MGYVNFFLGYEWDNQRDLTNKNGDFVGYERDLSNKHSDVMVSCAD